MDVATVWRSEAVLGGRRQRNLFPVHDLAIGQRHRWVAAGPASAVISLQDSTLFSAGSNIIPS